MLSRSWSVVSHNLCASFDCTHAMSQPTTCRRSNKRDQTESQTACMFQTQEWVLQCSVASTVVKRLIDRAVIGLPGKTFCSPARQLSLWYPQHGNSCLDRGGFSIAICDDNFQTCMRQSKHSGFDPHLSSAVWGAVRSASWTLSLLYLGPAHASQLIQLCVTRSKRCHHHIPEKESQESRRDLGTTTCY